MLQSVNPLLLALEALADEVLDQIYNLKEAGFYYLYVDPYYLKNVAATPKFTYGFEQLRNQAGTLLWLEKDQFDNETETTTFPTKVQVANGFVRPKLAVPRKLIPGGYNAGASSDPLKLISPYPQFTTMQVLDEFVKAFDDKGDVPRFKALPGAPMDGEAVYDSDGNAFTGWNRQSEFGVQLYNMGEEQEDGSVIKDYRAARVMINTKIAPGKPSVKGLTNFKTGCGAVAIVIGCPSFEIFAETFNKFSDMFQDLPEFAAQTGKQLLESFTDILTPANTVVKLTQCDTKYGLFEVDDVIGGEVYGGIGTIVEVDTESIKPTVMSSTVSTWKTDDIGLTKFVTEPYDPNGPKGKERWWDMTVTLTPYRTVDGLNPFITGDTVYEMEQRGTTVDGAKNYVTVGRDTVELPPVARVYPRVGKIAMEKLELLPDSTPPDFGGIQIKDIIPGWGEFFQILENFVKQLKGMISDSVSFIQDLIDMIKSIEAFLDELIKIITDFLAFFEKQLPSTGCYALYIENAQGGTDQIKSQIISAKTSLPDLAYAAGVMFVGLEVGGINPIELLATVLGLRQQK
jgi:hypothetical protein